MSKTKTVPVTLSTPAVVRSWDEANDVLGRIHGIDSRIAKDEAALNVLLQTKRTALSAEHAPLISKKAELETALRSWCEANKAEFETERSRTLTNGTVFYRTGNPVVKFIAASADEVVSLIRKSKSWSKKFLRVKTELDKRAVISAATAEVPSGKSISPEELEALGMKVEREENWGYKTATVGGANE